jgi:hypothetical protein
MPSAKKIFSSSTSGTRRQPCLRLNTNVTDCGSKVYRDPPFERRDLHESLQDQNRNAFSNTLFSNDLAVA